MPRSYTANQTGAIACLLASVVWGLTAHAVALMLGLSNPVYMIFIVAGWVLLPLNIKLVRHAFVIAIFILAVPMGYIAFLTSLLGTAAWFTFSRGLYDFTYVVWYLTALFGIYFCYRSWKELQKTA